MKKLIIFLILVLISIQTTFSFATVDATATRFSGPTRYETSLEVAKKVNANPDTIVFAYGNNYPDAIAGSVLTIGNNPMLLVEKDRIPPNMHDYVSKAERVIILGGKGVISEKVEEQLSRLGIKDVQRLSGVNRYETAVAVSKYVKDSSGYILASGQNYPDAISGNALTYQDGKKYPVLLTKKDYLPKSVKDQIRNSEKVYILGGKGVISSSVEDELSQLNIGEVVRLGGVDRYETAVKICEEIENPNKVIFVCGNNFPDALSASALSTKYSAPVVLSGTNKLLRSQKYLYYNSSTIGDAFIVGGRAVVSDWVKEEILDLIRGKVTDERYFTFDAGKKTITDYDESGPGFVIIPTKINGVEVQTIGDRSFSGKGLEGVIIPSGVEHISKEAFDSNKIKDVVLPDSLISIGSSAFSNNKLTKIEIPSSVEIIQSRAFINNKLSLVNLPDGIREVGPNVFVRVDGINPNVKKSGDILSFFINEDGVLTSYFSNDDEVTIPGGVNAIGDYAFHANGITSVTIPNGVSVIGDSAFWDNKIKKVILPGSVTEVQKYAFCYNKIETLTIPKSVKKLGEYSFIYNNLSEVSVPSDLNTTNVFDNWVIINEY
ncbi:MAG: hypothetical protein CSB16_00465 [Clostridiales bacterium]|nr:MAG: hypothetical protein CSB16_00465 [Clostridiales bacterium]